MISITNDAENSKQFFFPQKKDGKLENLQTTFKQALEQIRDQFEDHLETINDNTNELHASFDYIGQVELKLDKLTEKVDELSMLLKKQQGIDDKPFHFEPLTNREKEVFFALYTLSQDRHFVTYKDIARKLCDSESLVAAYITNLMEKGIPVKKKYVSRVALLSLDPRFRELQAKENIVGLNSKLTHWVR